MSSARRRPTRRAISFTVACLVALELGSPSAVSADEPWMLGLELDAMAPLRAPQTERFRPGGAGSVTLLRSLGAHFALGLRARGAWLTDGPAPADTTLVDPGTGGLGTLEMVVRPRLSTGGLRDARATGLFVELGGGAALTGGHLRATFGGALGYGIAAGPITVAPIARYQHVVQPSEGQLDARDASLLLVGIELVLFDPRARPPVAESTPFELDPSSVDRDGDGIPDARDVCPDEPEDLDGFEDDDGCPDLDDDGDGIFDVDDACPREPEDSDGFRDEDGCPDPDNDDDGILDVDDACPLEPEVVNGIDDADGCPDEGLIVMIDDRVVIDEHVLFDFERARVKSAARPVLDAIVELARQHPEWTQLRVEGHADRRGDEEFNLRLSERRARNVMRALLERGLEGREVTFVGFGASRPRDERRNEAAHQRNRRVEFVVVRRGGVDASSTRGHSADADHTDATLD
jgi:outer membrane protein OmpA-like peptidoglycan-associated protein